MSDLFAYNVLSVEDRMALTALCTEYAWRKDFFHYEKVPDLFTEDCVYEPPTGNASGGPPAGIVNVRTLRGRNEIIKDWTRRAALPILTRLLISNLRFLGDSPTTARGWIAFAEYAAKFGEPSVATPVMIGDFIDTYQKGADGVWRIKTRKAEIKFGGLPGPDGKLRIVIAARGAE